MGRGPQGGGGLRDAQGSRQHVSPLAAALQTQAKMVPAPCKPPYLSSPACSPRSGGESLVAP